ncbi:MAG: hypothetical protein SNH64_04605 [Rikenellaceae bacterium]
MEILLIVAIGAFFYYYLQRQDDKKRLAKQDYELRRLKGIKSSEDELESKNLLEDHHFKIILLQVQKDENFKWLDRDIQVDEAKRLFENKYGYNFSDPFKEY